MNPLYFSQMTARSTKKKFIFEPRLKYLRYCNTLMVKKWKKTN